MFRVEGFTQCTCPIHHTDPGGLSDHRLCPGRGGEDISLEEELEFLAEEDVVLAAAKHKQKIGFSPSAVIVITRKDIEESGATCFMDLLRLYPAAPGFTASRFSSRWVKFCMSEFTTSMPCFNTYAYDRWNGLNGHAFSSSS